MHRTRRGAADASAFQPHSAVTGAVGKAVDTAAATGVVIIAGTAGIAGIAVTGTGANGIAVDTDAGIATGIATDMKGCIDVEACKVRATAVPSTGGGEQLPTRASKARALPLLEACWEGGREGSGVVEVYLSPRQSMSERTCSVDMTASGVTHMSPPPPPSVSRDGAALGAEHEGAPEAGSSGPNSWGGSGKASDALLSRPASEVLLERPSIEGV